MGADLPTYSPTAADVGKTVTVTVVGSVAGLGSTAATSAPTAAVTGGAVQQQPPPPPTALHVGNLKLPVIKGTLEVGRRARVRRVDGTRRRDADLQVVRRRQARRQGRQRKLKLKENWVGKRLKVVVLAKADGYLATKVTTQRSSRIKP